MRESEKQFLEVYSSKPDFLSHVLKSRKKHDDIGAVAH